jgi:hypothetical protein
MRMNLPAQVASAAERRSAIVDILSRAGEDVTHFVPSPEGYLEVPVVGVPARLLVYRMENGRILSELTEEARKQNVALEDFKQRSETVEIQRLLHRLLFDKARDPGAPIYQELERYERQTEPLLIQRDGMVLNGNRRLAAMRELREQNGERFGQFETVSVALLPDDLEREQLEVIEAALQMAPNLKLEYGWISRRLKLRQHARDIDRERIVEAYRFPDAAAIDVELGELELAETYLEWIGQPQHFALVEGHETHFAKMYEKLHLLKQAHVRDVWTLFGFAMLRAEGAIDGKILHYFPFTDPVPPGLRHWVPRTLAEDRGLTDRQDVGENRPFDKALAARLRPLIDDPHHAESTATAVVALSDILKGNERKLLGFDQLLAQLRKAHETLQQIDVEKLSPAQLRRVRAQIAALWEQLGTSSRGTATSSGFPESKRDLQEVLHDAWRDAKRILRR